MTKKQARVRRPRLKPLELGGRRLTQWQKLKEEYESLKQERTRLRNEIVQLDSRLENGSLTEMQRDKEFRQRLCKAGEISRRLAQVVSEMSRLGRIPEERRE